MTPGSQEKAIHDASERIVDMLLWFNMDLWLPILQTAEKKIKAELES